MSTSSSEIYLKCELSRSGFANERVFRLKTLDDQTLIGVAALDYCRKSNGTALGADEPSQKSRISGLVAARIITQIEDENAVLVSVPSGDVVRVADETIADVKSPGTSPDVSLKS